MGRAGREERFGEGSEDRGVSKEGRVEVVGVEIKGVELWLLLLLFGRRPLREGSRGLAIVDIVLGS